MSKIVEVLEKHGATDIEDYSLISNYGYTFFINGVKYDARFWANCYGAALNIWQIHNCDPENRRIDVKTLRKIEEELNEIGEEW